MSIIDLFLKLGGYLWSGSIDCTINIWDLNTKALYRTIRSSGDENFADASDGHSSAITCMTMISFEGVNFIATASLDCMFMVWNSDNQKVFECLEQDVISTMSVSADLSGFITHSLTLHFPTTYECNYQVNHCYFLALNVVTL